jgi:hypothetical protein
VIEKVFSDGQTGAEQAWLDETIELGIPPAGGSPEAARRKRGCRRTFKR